MPHKNSKKNKLYDDFGRLVDSINVSRKIKKINFEINKKKQEGL